MDELKIVNIISNPTRFKILIHLLNGVTTTAALAEKLGISEAGIAQQMNILKSAGIVTGRRDSHYVHYSADRYMIMNAVEKFRMDILKAGK